MVEAKYVTGNDIKIMLEEEEKIPFSFPATKEGRQLYRDLTLAQEFPANSTPYSDALSELVPEADVTTYFLAKDKGDTDRQLFQNLIEVNDASGPTSPATGIFFSMTGEGTTLWKGDSHAYRDSYDPEEIQQWMDLSLRDVEPETSEITGDTSRKLTDTGYENVKGRTVATLEFEDVTIPNSGRGRALREKAMDSLYQALENGDYLAGPPPSYVINQSESGHDDFMDAPRIASVMIEDQELPLTGALNGQKPAFYLGEENAVKLPSHVALTYLVENGQEFDATADFIESYTSGLEPVEAELDPGDDPMVQ